MKRTLIIIRHGKAESFGIVSEDYARTLVPDGVKEAKYTGNALKKVCVAPQLYLSSAAPRAFYTLRFIALTLGADPESVIGDRDLYSARRESLLETIRNFPDDVTCAALCGHNPEISDLIPLLVEDTGRLPFLNTADAVVIDLPEGASWSDAGAGNAVLRIFISQPRRRIS
jgi:phosphohistidine phosphatase